MTPDGMVSTFSQSFSGSGSLNAVNGLAFQPQTVPEPSALSFLADWVGKAGNSEYSVSYESAMLFGVSLLQD